MLAVFIITFVIAILVRPYRDTQTNILMILLSAKFFVFTIIMQMKIQGANSDLFSEGFFFWFIIVINGLFWFIILLQFLVLVMING